MIYFNPIDISAIKQPQPQPQQPTTNNNQQHNHNNCRDVDSLQHSYRADGVLASLFEPVSRPVRSGSFALSASRELCSAEGAVEDGVHEARGGEVVSAHQASSS